MIVVPPPGSEGVLIYLDLYGEVWSDKVAEFRFERTDRMEHYIATLYGSIIPTVVYRTPTTDRVFVKLPWLEEHMIVPIFMKRVVSNPYYFDEPIVIIHDYGRLPQYIVGVDGVYNVTVDGFYIQNGSIKIECTYSLPLKHKFLFANTDYTATFYAIDPATNLLKWEIAISDTVAINGNAVGTIDASYKKEVDIAFSDSKLAVTFYGDDFDTIVFEDTTPLDVQAPYQNTSLAIAASNLTIYELIVFNSAPEPTPIAGWQPYTNILIPMVVGFPKLNYPQRHKMLVDYREKYETNAPLRRTFGRVVAGFNKQTVVASGEVKRLITATQFMLSKLIEDKRATAFKITAQKILNNATVFTIGSLTGIGNYKLKVTVAESVYKLRKVLVDIRRVVESNLPVLREIRHIEEQFNKMMITIADPEGLRIINQYPIRLAVENVFYDMAWYFFMIVPKYAASIIIEADEYVDIVFRSIDYSVEVDADEA